MVLVPEKASIGVDTLRGNVMPIVNLKMERNNPRGNHMNKARQEAGVGLKANLPSWKINGFGYLSLGRACQFLLSSEFNIKEPSCRNKAGEKVIFSIKSHDMSVHMCVSFLMAKP